MGGGQAAQYAEAFSRRGDSESQVQRLIRRFPRGCGIRLFGHGADMSGSNLGLVSSHSPEPHANCAYITSTLIPGNRRRVSIRALCCYV